MTPKPDVRREPPRRPWAGRSTWAALASEIISHVEWQDPFDQELAFGGEASLSIDDVAVDGRDVMVGRDVTDAHDHSFAVALATELCPFLDLPGVLELEDVESVVRDSAPEAGEVILRLRYRLVLQADTGHYSGVVRDRQGFSLR